MFSILRRFIFVHVLAFFVTFYLLLFSSVASSAEIALDLFAVVEGIEIKAERYNALVQTEVRQKFYHAKVPPEEMSAYRQEVADKLIDEILLLMEAERQSVQPDNEFIEEQFRQYDEQYKNSPRYKRERNKMLARIRPKLERESKIERITKIIRQVTPPTDSEVKKYYQNNPDKFTTPGKKRVSVILLSVDPSSATEVWKAAEAESMLIYQKVKQGDDFAMLAEIHSGDESAASGGDMGFLHDGMLNSKVEEVLVKMNAGEISQPQKLLQGYAIFRLDERVKPRLNSYEKVKNRAFRLAEREKADDKFAKFKHDLRINKKITLNARLIEQGK